MALVKDLYADAHLVVAAIRFLEHTRKTPVNQQDLAEALGFNLERVLFICRRLEETAAIECLKGAFGDRIVIKDHLKLETLPRGEQESKLDEELKRFQKERGKMSQKVETLKADQKKKQQDLFAEIERKLKGNLSPKK
jgi:hypothetical protein